MSAPTYQIALIGNPNSGKTTLFNALTGSRQRTGNWPGVTVDRKSGHYHHHHHCSEGCVCKKLQEKRTGRDDRLRVEVVDLPGTYAIESSSSDISQDEMIARNFILNEKNTLLINIVDATNLQRNLYLTFQLLDLGQPMVVALNMIDAVHNNGEEIDIELLQKRLGCPVIGISASRGEGLQQLRDAVHQAALEKQRPQPQIPTIGDKQEQMLTQFLRNLPIGSALHRMSRWQLFDALLLPENDVHFDDETRKEVQACRDTTASWGNGEIDIALASARYDAIDALCRDVIHRPREASKSLTAFLDRFALGRITGIPVFLAAMYLMFLLAINAGSAFIDFFDILFGTLLVDGIGHLLNAIDAPDWLIAILANGLGGGIQTVSTFVPVIAAMFLCLSFMEDSGYLARAAMVVDRGMRSIGLPGKAFVPMLVGFGCNVPAIMGTRTLESTRDRLMSIMMIPYMSCGARLPVYALLVAIFFPTNGQNIVFGLYLGGIAIAILTGLVLKHTLLPGAITPFIMELPPYRMPTLRNMLLLTWERLKMFIIRAGKVIVLMVMVLSFFNSLGTDGSFNNENTDKSVLSNVGKAITPLFTPMGIEERNWPATVGIFTGIFAKEAVIGTLNALYEQMGEEDDGSSEEGGYQPLEGIKEAFATIPANLGDLLSSVTDPLGITSTLGDVESVSEDQEVSPAAVGQIHLAFGSTGAVIAFLIFILLYTPCAAALGAIYREAGGKWAATVAVWTFVLAWVCSTAYYQLSLLGTASVSASVWLVGLAAALVGLFFVLRFFGLSQRNIKLPSPQSPSDGHCC
ncbi:MAG: Fe(2+) transporter permease subunit FeoB [Burkholderiales bacterium]|jgi:ferrous iron transport protein B|nr:Fe(2+) transporter permease subunit FeoB [Burkholderiales bacterium]